MSGLFESTRVLAEPDTFVRPDLEDLFGVDRNTALRLQLAALHTRCDILPTISVSFATVAVPYIPKDMPMVSFTSGDFLPRKGMLTRYAKKASDGSK